MFDNPRKETSYTLWRWLLVLYLLVAPRVVGHCHADAALWDGPNSSLAAHLERFHSSDDFPVGDFQFHFHLAFSILPAETPCGTAIDNAVCSGCESSSSVYDPSQPVCLSDQLLHDCECERETHSRVTVTGNHHSFSANSFRRVCFCVWNI
jgi:hypothetical protein